MSVYSVGDYITSGKLFGDVLKGTSENIDMLLGITESELRYVRNQLKQGISNLSFDKYEKLAKRETELVNKVNQLYNKWGIEHTYTKGGGKPKRKSARKPRKALRKTKQNKKRANKRKTQGKKK